MKKAILIILGIVNLFGWEINTHRAIDRQAVKYSSNFQYFIDHSGVKGQNYINEKFEGYGHTYIDYVLNREENGISANKWNQYFFLAPTLHVGVYTYVEASSGVWIPAYNVGTREMRLCGTTFR